MYIHISANIEDANEFIANRNERAKSLVMDMFGEELTEKDLVPLIPTFRVNTFQLLVNQKTQYQFCLN